MRTQIRLVLVTALSLASLAAGGLVPSAAAGVSERRFVVDCGFSHRLSDDPIVKPAMPGASHSHDFFGNRSTNAFSTLETLRAGSTTCSRNGADLSAYWAPTLTDAGKAIPPWGMSAYYTTRGKQPGTIKAFPDGLRIVAGNAAATAPQAPMVTVWTCGNIVSTESSRVPMCPSGPRYSLFAHVRFPDCWNGKDLDWPDHRSHMAYSMKGVCPSGYPVALPGLQLNVAWPVRGGSGISFSSGSPYSAHADFFNAWHPAVLAFLVENCLNQGYRCE